MKFLPVQLLASLFVVAGLTFTGCAGDVETTEESTRVEAEGPVVETGEEDTDFDPSTDEDVDVDTPLEGDT